MSEKVVQIGFEVGTGNPVAIPLGHLAVSGQTQKSGKTTTLEALISRSGYRAIAFVTKRGESAFKQSRIIPPYFRHRADWQFVSEILGATFNEKMKFQRYWIMEICRGARTLKDVQRKNEQKLKEAKRGLDIAIFTELQEYLKVAVPDLDRLPFTTELDLAPGINVMDLSEYSTPLQMLVISSVLEHVYTHERELIVIVPEAWEFVPQKRSSPVMKPAEALIRKSAARKIFVWLDSQDLAGVHKDILKHVSVWILGVQREENEVQRTLKHIFGAKLKIGVSDVRGLGLGQFFVCFEQQTVKVYVAPAWMPSDIAQKIAEGKLAVQDAWQVAPGRAGILHHTPPSGEGAGSRVITGKEQALPIVSSFRKEDEVTNAEAEALREENASLKEQVRQLRQQLGLDGAQPGQAITALNPGSEIDALLDGLHESNRIAREALIAEVLDRIRKDPGLIHLATQQPEISVTVRRHVVQLDDGTLRGRLAVMVTQKFFDSPTNGNTAFNELQKRGFSTAKPNVYRELDKLTEMGFLLKLDSGYQAVPGMKITRNTMEAA